MVQGASIRDKASGGGETDNPSNNGATVQHLGCTLAQYAESKGLPLDFLRGLGLTQITYFNSPAVRIPYLDESGAEVAVRFRLALEGENRFRWKSGAKPCLYGLWRLGQAREEGCVVLVEGESDCHTLWHHDVQALGIPGANNWREVRDAPFLDGISTIYVVVEPDRGGESIKGWLATSSIRDRVRLIYLGEDKGIG